LDELKGCRRYSMSLDAAELRLLAPDEPPSFLVERRHGTSSFVIAVDHASARIPRRLGNLGLSTAELQRHTAWDIGSLAVAQRISATLDAPLVAQSYSRLVIDCNREPGVATSIPTMAESVEVPGNIGLSDRDIDMRRTEVFEPYHAYLRALLDERQAAGRRTILVCQHTMTDIFKGARREMHASVLYGRDRHFAGLVLEVLRREAELLIGDNEPYTIDETHYTIPKHAEAREMPYVEIEIRQDLVRDEFGQNRWGRRISDALRTAEEIYSEER
jgi:predicted N-formylglutamate amidohydrolase